jgi:chemotaxis protein CheC
MNIRKEPSWVNNVFNLNPQQLDTLKELGNIGSGNAIVALSNIINKPIETSLTSIKIIPFWSFVNVFNDPNLYVFGIYSAVESKPNLSLLQIFTKKSIINLINLLSGNNRSILHDINDKEELCEYGKSIIFEVGNILAGHYTSALANLMSIKIIPSVPVLALDTVGAICDSLIAKFSSKTDYIIMIDTEMIIEELSFNGFFVFIPSLETIKTLFNLLNISQNEDKQ